MEAWKGLVLPIKVEGSQAEVDKKLVKWAWKHERG